MWKWHCALGTIKTQDEDMGRAEKKKKEKSYGYGNDDKIKQEAKGETKNYVPCKLSMKIKSFPILCAIVCRSIGY
jgi:hypothetical protein